jgi:hypothetical protein
MTPEDEEFERISREIRRNAAEDDDIQDYKKPWVGLTDEEFNELYDKYVPEACYALLIEKVEAKLKEKNF